MNRPCIGCGTPIRTGSRCGPCTPTRTPTRGTKGRTATDWQHRKQSQGQRKRVPFCELRTSPRCTGRAETLDHVVPVSQRPDLAHAPENHRSACRPCNSARGANYTRQEQRRVEQAIDARRTRATHHYTYAANQQN